jgi:hypothetical protein
MKATKSQYRVSVYTDNGDASIRLRFIATPDKEQFVQDVNDCIRLCGVRSELCSLSVAMPGMTVLDRIISINYKSAHRYKFVIDDSPAGFALIVTPESEGR